MVRKERDDCLSNLELWEHQKEGVRRALSQPNFGFLFEQGCVAADTMVRYNRAKLSRNRTIAHLYKTFHKMHKNGRYTKETKTFVRSNVDGVMRLNEVHDVVYSGKKECFRLTLADGKFLDATEDHEIFTDNGFIALGKLDKEKDLVAVDNLARHQKKIAPKRRKRLRDLRENVGKYHPYGHKIKRYYTKKCGVLSTTYANIVELHRAIYEANLNRMTLEEFKKATYKKNTLLFIDPDKFHIHHINGDHSDNSIENLTHLTAHEHRVLHGKKSYNNFSHGAIEFVSIDSICSVGIKDTYDIKCYAPHNNFAANGIVIHNCGKSASVIHTVRGRFNQAGRVMRTLVIGPLIVVENWKREFAKFAPTVPQSKVIALTGTGANKAKIVKKNIGYDCIMVVNYDALQNEELLAALLEWSPEIIIYDESQRLKSPTSKRTKNCFKLRQSCKFAYILSGTPILKSKLDLFGQFLVLDNGASFGTNFFKFRLKWFVDKNVHMPRAKHFPNFVERTEMSQYFADLVDKSTLAVKKETCLDLPPLIRQTVYVELGKDQSRVYKELERHFIAFLGDETCAAPLAITKGLRMQQVLSGHLPMDNGEVVSFDDNPRATALEELLEDIAPHHKVIVWCVWKEDYKQVRAICTKLKLESRELHGEIPNKDRVQFMDDFNGNDKVRVLIGNPVACGLGVNLVAASYSIYYSRNYSLENDLQSMARNYRYGSGVHDKVVRIDIVAKDTLDEVVLESLAAKEEIGLKTLRYYAKKACNK